MLAAVLTGIGAVDLVERRPPKRRTGHALVRVELVGLCGSDLSYFAKGANGDFVVREPLVLGHEIIATVIETDPQPGPGAPRVGDLVAVHPAWPSPLPGESGIPKALAGEAASFLGSASTSPHTDGGLQEHLAVRTERLRVIPEPLTAATAVLAEPTAVVLHALSHAGDLRGRRVLICGAGPIGLLALLALRARGAAEIVVTDVRADALELARTLGADALVDAGREVPAPSWFDVAVEASGAPAALESAVVATRQGGTVVQIGMLPRDPRPMSLAGIVTKELTVVGSHRFTGELDDALELLARTPSAAGIVSTIVPLADVARAFDAVADPSVPGKVVVAVHDPSPR